MTLEMTESEQQLIDSAKTIILPGNIDGDAYSKMTYLLSYAKDRHPNDRIKLLCRGEGGEAWFAMAIIGAIREHGQVDGVLNGHAISSHCTIWVHCEERFYTPEGAIGIHPASLRLEGSYEAAELVAFQDDLTHLDELIIERLAAISLQAKKWWTARYYPPKAATKALYADDIEELSMASALKDRNEKGKK